MKQQIISPQMSNHETQLLDTYLKEIGNEKQLTTEEEAVLTQRIRGGDSKALDKLIRANLRFVVSIAKQYQGLGMSMSDLINEGNIGMIKAAERFDETSGVRFVSYAAWWIRQSIIEAITTGGNIVKTDEKRLHKEYTISNKQQSLDAPISEGNKNSLLDVIINNDSPLGDDELFQKSLREEINDALQFLSERERLVLDAYFGINNPPITMAEIGQQYGLSRERVRQIRKKALRHLRSNVKNNTLRTYLNTIK